MTILHIAVVVALLIFGSMVASVVAASLATWLVSLPGRIAAWFDNALFGGE